MCNGPRPNNSFDLHPRRAEAKAGLQSTGNPQDTGLLTLISVQNRERSVADGRDVALSVSDRSSVYPTNPFDLINMNFDTSSTFKELVNKREQITVVAASVFTPPL